ncbi:pheromone-binding protein-related protein 6 [Aethina tumida]|uniref:pheromone-binding protein-related protein 6 n=1 Tax=Aethina tumida TaxID=116153 RepID=UPI00096B6353|nr:pheromone-binding protein-related protein 6 [Aethina tumida]
MANKSVVFVLALLTVGVFSVEIPSDLQEFIDDIHDTCIKKSGITDEDHTKYDIKNKDPKMMEYMKCLMLESKWMSPSGEIEYSFIEDSAHPKIKDLLMAALNQCRHIEGADLAEKAYNFNYCMFEADPNNWFFV